MFGAAENEDRANGRAGSVCDLRRKNANKKASSPVSVAMPTGGGVKTAPDNGGGTPQQRQLEALLHRPESDGATTTTEAYALERERFALLRAFERKLRGLYADSLDKCRAAESGVAGLDERHPEHRAAYRDHYTRALRESGIRDDPEHCPLLRYLDCDGPQSRLPSEGDEGKSLVSIESECQLRSRQPVADG